ncbi:unnamed protein product [Calypogeia fissa]
MLCFPALEEVDEEEAEVLLLPPSLSAWEVARTEEERAETGHKVCEEKKKRIQRKKRVWASLLLFSGHLRTPHVE